MKLKWFDLIESGLVVNEYALLRLDEEVFPTVFEAHDNKYVVKQRINDSFNVVVSGQTKNLDMAKDKCQLWLETHSGLEQPTQASGFSIPNIKARLDEVHLSKRRRIYRWTASLFIALGLTFIISMNLYRILVFLWLHFKSELVLSMVVLAGTAKPFSSLVKNLRGNRIIRRFVLK